MSYIKVKDFGGVVSNAVVYGLEESIRRAKFPMSVDIDSIISAQELEFWNKDNFLEKFVKHIDSGIYPKYLFSEENDCVIMQLMGDDNNISDILIDEEDVPKIFPYKWHYDSYCRSINAGLMHRFILSEILCNDNSIVVDHINRNTYDNRKSNLRLATRRQNGYNAKTRKNNSSGVMGVSWSKEKQRWRSTITENGTQIFLGWYSNFDDAVRARLLREKETCGEFAPQANLYAKYGIDNDKNVTRFSVEHIRLKDAVAAYRNIVRLADAEKGSGHDQALTGIVVQFDLSFTNKAWVEAERYHFLDFVSSQSTMHRITKFNLDNAYNGFVDRRIIEIMKEKVADYNSMVDGDVKEYEKQTKYLEILYNNPAGFIITAGMTTNYRQLKTIYAQRKNHRLPEWRAFCQWIETLPMSELITNIKGE